MGRPSEFAPKVAESICSQIAKGASLRKICAADDMPSLSCVFNWLHSRPEFVEQYARAREQQAEHFADELIEIADGIDDSDADVQRDRLRVDTRKWIASKLKPRKFGDVTKHEHTGADGGPVRQIIGIEIVGVGPKAEDGSTE